MREKSPTAYAVPEGRLFEPQDEPDRERYRKTSDSYLKDEGPERESQDWDLDELTVPPGERPEACLGHRVEESDVIDLILPPSEIPEGVARRETKANSRLGAAAEQRARAYSTISAAVTSAVDQSANGPSEIEKAVQESADRGGRKTPETDPEG